MPKMKKSLLVKLIILPLLFATIFFLKTDKVFAAATDPISVCQPYDASWKLIPWKAIDIQNTTENLLTSVANTLFAKVFGKGTTDVVTCEAYISTLNNLSPNKCTNGLGGTLDKCGADATKDEKAVCEEIMNSTKITYMYNGKPASLVAVNTSLIGISSKVQNSALRDPIVLNLAYFGKSQLAKIPFVGKTYAATLDASNMAIINAVLGVWKASRDISLAFIAVILMYTGLLIVMRKKINPQLVVTVQYAIPKIIIGLILILFSYPIGAAITGLSWGLFRSSTAIVVNALYGNAVEAASFPNQVLLSLVIGSLKMGFFAGVGIILVILVAIASIVMMVVVYIKAIVIYLKMVFSTIIAPFEFALGTVPGSEEKIKDWFLRMAKYGLTIFAMGLVIPVTLSVAFEIMMYYSCACSIAGACDIETAGMGAFLMFAAPLMIVILGFSLAFKMEASIDQMFFGGKPKRK